MTESFAFDINCGVKPRKFNGMKEQMEKLLIYLIVKTTRDIKMGKSYLKMDGDFQN